MSSIYLIIIGIAIGSFLIRFSFLGFIGNKELPEWCLRHLRYVAVAVLPAIITPLILYPKANNGDFDILRVTAALVAFFIGYRFNSVIGAIFSGMVTLYSVQYFFS